jgi:hypothetical protein
MVTKKDLIKMLDKYDDDMLVVISVSPLIAAEEYFARETTFITGQGEYPAVMLQATAIQR